MIRITDSYSGEVKLYQVEEVDACVIMGMGMIEEWSEMSKNWDEKPSLTIETDNKKVLDMMINYSKTRTDGIIKEIKHTDGRKLALFYIESILMLRSHELTASVHQGLIEAAKALGSSNFK